MKLLAVRLLLTAYTSKSKWSNLGRQKAHHSVALCIPARKLHSQDAVLSCQVSRDSIRWQFACGQHDVAEVEGGVVDRAQLLVVLHDGGGAEVLERRLHPVQAGEVTAGQDVHVRVVAGLGLRQYICKSKQSKTITGLAFKTGKIQLA